MKELIRSDSLAQTVLVGYFLVLSAIAGAWLLLGAGEHFRPENFHPREWYWTQYASAWSTGLWIVSHAAAFIFNCAHGFEIYHKK